MIGLKVTGEDWIAQLTTYIAQYEHYCEVRTFADYREANSNLLQQVSEEHGKNFDFPKQHWLLHIVEDLQTKGATPNYSTWPSEGFQQEAGKTYKQTNGKNLDSQVNYLWLLSALLNEGSVGCY